MARCVDVRLAVPNGQLSFIFFSVSEVMWGSEKKAHEDLGFGEHSLVA